MNIQKISITREDKPENISYHSKISYIKKQLNDSEIIHLSAANALDIRYDKAEITRIMSRKDTKFICGILNFPSKGPLIEEVFYNILSNPFVAGDSGRRFKNNKKPSSKLYSAVDISVFNLFLKKDFFLNLDDDISVSDLHKALFVLYTKEPSMGLFFPAAELDLPIRTLNELLFEATCSMRYGRNPFLSAGFWIAFISGMIISFFFDPMEYFIDAYLIYLIVTSFVLSNWSFVTFFHYLFFIPFIHIFNAIAAVKALIKKGK